MTLERLVNFCYNGVTAKMVREKLQYRKKN